MQFLIFDMVVQFHAVKHHIISFWSTPNIHNTKHPTAGLPRRCTKDVVQYLDRIYCVNSKFYREKPSCFFWSNAKSFIAVKIEPDVLLTTKIELKEDTKY
jgi:hypothetical protein